MKFPSQKMAQSLKMEFTIVQKDNTLQLLGSTLIGHLIALHDHGPYLVNEKTNNLGKSRTQWPYRVSLKMNTTWAMIRLCNRNPNYIIVMDKISFYCKSDVPPTNVMIDSKYTSYQQFDWSYMFLKPSNGLSRFIWNTIELNNICY